jgi:hypothetical protein
LVGDGATNGWYGKGHFFAAAATCGEFHLRGESNECACDARRTEKSPGKREK